MIHFDSCVSQNFVGLSVLCQKIRELGPSLVLEIIAFKTLVFGKKWQKSWKSEFSRPAEVSTICRGVSASAHTTPGNEVVAKNKRPITIQHRQSRDSNVTSWLFMNKQKCYLDSFVYFCVLSTRFCKHLLNNYNYFSIHLNRSIWG